MSPLNAMARTRKYYLKNNYLTLRSKVKVPLPQQPLGCSRRHYKRCRIAFIIVRNFHLFSWSLAYRGKWCWISHWGQRSRSHEGHYSTRHTARWSCTHIPNIIDLSRKTKMLWPGQENTIWKTVIWPWGQRSKSREVITVCNTPPYGPRSNNCFFK
jgi:hypothetical protein